MFRLQALILCVAATLIWGCGDPVPENEIAISEPELRQMPLEDRKERFEDNADDPVTYRNEATGHKAQYDLDVEYSSSGEVERINFPNGGWIDDFTDQTDNGDGTLTVEAGDGREFVVPKP